MVPDHLGDDEMTMKQHQMKKRSIAGMAIILGALLLAGCTAPTPPKPQRADSRPAKPAHAAKALEHGPWEWHDVRDMTVEGKGWADTAKFFHRLPDKVQGVVRLPVWNLSTRSAGICARFVTDADRIAARWKLTMSRLQLNHMPATGVSGLDLYIRHEGRWQWIGVGRPTDLHVNQDILAESIPDGFHEYLLYLPLYNSVDSVELGLPPGAELRDAPPRPPAKAKPICFYGTSIVQGGCASRPGMTHSAILGRKLDWPVINLGFSGNGQMEIELAQLLGELDVAVYVVDCLPNMTADMVDERVQPFVETLRRLRPQTPIIMVENIAYQAGAFLPEARKRYQVKNAALRKVYQHLLADGVSNLSYVPCEALLGNDGDATVDGTHPTDLGFYRFAQALEPVLRKACNAK